VTRRRPRVRASQAIRTDNGVPFASPNALYRLSKLAVWWLRLGIRFERIKPGHPEQKGRHERIQLTLKKESHQARRPQLPAAASEVRGLHRLLQPGAPASGARHERIRLSSIGPHRGLVELDYPFHDRTITVTHCGRICLAKR